MTTLFLRLLPYLAGVALILGGLWWVHHKGFDAGYAEREAYWKPLFDAADSARAVAEARTASQEAESTLISARLEAEHAAVVSSLTLRAVAADGRVRGLMRQHATARTSCGPVSAVSGPASEPNATDSGVELAERAGGDLVALARRCEADAAALTSLQQWIREQQLSAADHGAIHRP